MDTKAQELAHRLRTGRTEMATIQEAAAELLHLEDELVREQARAKELEAQLEAVGAGGVQPLRPEGGPPGSGDWQFHAEEMERQRDHWRQRAQTMHEHQAGQVWYWQGDGGDHPESMVNSLPAVIRLKDLLGKANALCRVRDARIKEIEAEQLRLQGDMDARLAACDALIRQMLEALELLTDGYDGNAVGLEVEAITAARAWLDGAALSRQPPPGHTAAHLRTLIDLLNRT
ncbi:MAG: hypothetical protein ACK40S_02995 [Burkholderiaceae bacterium]